MTIKQQGGVFGRNPTFNDVTVDGDLDVTDGSVSGTLSFPDNAQARFGNSNDLLIYHNGGNSLILDNGAGDLVLGCQNFRLLSNSLAKNMLKGFVDGSVEVYHNNVLAFSSGANGVVIPDGKGIDFSATSGTGTSELFDDYEEGTWTPAVSSGISGVGYASQSGVYTKIGNLVTISGQISTNAGTATANQFKITGLPFSVGQIGGAFFTYLNTGVAASLWIAYNEMAGYQATGGNLNGTDLGDAANTIIYFTGQYTAS